MMDWQNIYRMAKPWLFGALLVLGSLVPALLAHAIWQENGLAGAAPVLPAEQVIEIIKHDPDPYDRFVMNMDRRHAERVMDIMIASGGYADLPDIVDLEDGRVEIIALRSTE